MNESPDRGQSELPQDLTKGDKGSGVPQEYFSVAHGRCVTITDTRLVRCEAMDGPARGSSGSSRGIVRRLLGVPGRLSNFFWARLAAGQWRSYRLHKHLRLEASNGDLKSDPGRSHVFESLCGSAAHVSGPCAKHQSSVTAHTACPCSST